MRFWVLVKKTIQWVLLITLGIVFCLTLALAVISMTSHTGVASKHPVLAATKPLIVLSGSMDPTISSGDMVIIRAVPCASLNKGDIITFYQIANKDGRQQAGKVLVTHRITGIKDAAQGATGHLFITKGDANKANDAWEIPERDVVGKVYVIVPYAGKVLQVMSSKFGYVVLVLIPALLIIIGEIRKIIRYLRDAEPETIAGDNIRNDKQSPACSKRIQDAPIRQHALQNIAYRRVAVALALIMLFSTYTVASGFFSCATTIPIKFSFRQIADCIKLKPGCARAFRYDADCSCFWFSVAQVAPSGALELDFGEVKPREKRVFFDVVRVKNISSGNIRVSAKIEGELGFIIDSVSFSRFLEQRSKYVLKPGEQVSMDVALKVHPKLLPGTYTGSIVIESCDGRFKQVLPTKIDIIDRHNKSNNDRKTLSESALDDFSDTAGALTSTATVEKGGMDEVSGNDGASSDKSNLDNDDFDNRRHNTYEQQRSSHGSGNRLIILEEQAVSSITETDSVHSRYPR